MTKSKKIKLIGLFSLVLMAAVFVIPQATFAAGEGAGIANWFEEKIFLILAYVVYGIVWVIGQLFIFMTWILQDVFEYNKFINVATVHTGWVIVRDLCNMFFVLILLVIAFATILRQESYSAKRLLGKLIIMAVMINFSKMICGLIIDASQIVMLTFVNGLGTESNNLLDLLGLRHIISLAEKVNENPQVQVDILPLFGGLLAGLGAAIVAFVVVVVLLITLVFRIVMLWIYVILSPIAYLCSAFPGGQKYAGQWWSEFTKQVVTGPILAFFYWLALSTASTSMISTMEKASTFSSNIPSDFWKPAIFQTYAITLALLVGGLIVTQQAGGFAGSMAGKGIGWAQKYTGARRLRERYDAFASRRESERKAKVSESGDRWFARYKAATTAPKAVGSAMATALGNRVVPQKYRDWQQGRAEKKDVKRKEREAVAEMQEAPIGKAEWKNGVLYQKTASGVRVYDKKAKGGRREVSNWKVDTRRAYDEAYSPARRVIDETAKTRVDKIKSNLSSLSSVNLRGVLKDALKSKEERMAATMMLAAREGFKNQDQLRSAKGNLSGLPTLLKEFNDTIDRRFGVWNNTPEEFAAKVSDGTIRVDNIDTVQLNPKVLDMLQNTVGNVKYGDVMENMSRTQEDYKNIRNASLEKINELNISSNGYNENAMVQRGFYARHSGDVTGAMNNNEVEMGKLIKDAKIDHLSKIKEDNFSSPEFVRSFANNIRVAQLDGAQRAGKIKPAVLKRMIDEAVKAATVRGDTDFLEAINKNNNLNSIAKSTV